MIAVAISGIIGRYLYIQIPRSRDGHELSLTEIKSEYNKLVHQLTPQFDLNEEAMAKIKTLHLSSFSKEDANFRSFIKSAISELWNPVRIIHYKRLLASSHAIPRENITPIIQIILKKNRIEKRLHFLNLLHSLFHYWHVLHKPFAIIMYLIMFVHLGISIWLGYTWIF